MRLNLLIRFLLIVTLCGCLNAVYGQTPPLAAQNQAALEDQLGKLPAELRERGRAVLLEKDEARRAQLLRNLAREQGERIAEFLMALLTTETSSKVRLEVVDRLSRFAANPAVRQSLERSVLTDADSAVALLALDQLREQQTRALAQLLRQRIERARATGDENELRRLGLEQERWFALARGSMLPAFLRTPPPVFALKEAAPSLRVLAFGDFGSGSTDQKQVAAAMLKQSRQTPFDLAITLGDNFYPKGMESLTDPRWRTWWADLYDPLQIQFYASLGNHDWGFADSPAAEILYSKQSPSWRMPAPYYTFTAGPAQFFALDTSEISEAQLLWLNAELGKSRAVWKIVYGHHPIFSAGRYSDNEGMIKRLLPVLKDRADVYLAGHDHDLQHLQARDGVHFFVAGGGGASVREPAQGKPHSLFARAEHGFCVLEADGKQLKVRFQNRALDILYEATLEKSGTRAILVGAEKGQ